MKMRKGMRLTWVEELAIEPPIRYNACSTFQASSAAGVVLAKWLRDLKVPCT